MWRSAGRVSFLASRRHHTRSPSESPINAALITKTCVPPKDPSRSPAAAGPIPRAMFEMPAERLAAAGICSRFTTPGNTAGHVGIVEVPPIDIAKVAAINISDVIPPRTEPAASATATVKRQLWATSNRRRRSSTSAIAPAGSANRKNGRLKAACIRVTRTGDFPSSVADSHALAVSCIIPARVDASDATHSARRIEFCLSKVPDEAGEGASTKVRIFARRSRTRDAASVTTSDRSTHGYKREADPQRSRAFKKDFQGPRVDLRFDRVIRTPRAVSRFLIGLCLAILAALIVPPAPAHAEVTDLKITRGYGTVYFALMVMEQNQLLEKQAKAARLGDLKINYLVVDGGNVINDALLTGSLDIAATGVPSFLTLWAKVKGSPQEISALSALSTSPMYLNSTNPKVKTLRDFTESDRIA